MTDAAMKEKDLREKVNKIHAKVTEAANRIEELKLQIDEQLKAGDVDVDDLALAIKKHEETKDRAMIAYESLAGQLRIATKAVEVERLEGMADEFMGKFESDILPQIREAVKERLDFIQEANILTLNKGLFAEDPARELWGMNHGEPKAAIAFIAAKMLGANIPRR